MLCRGHFILEQVKVTTVRLELARGAVLFAFIHQAEQRIKIDAFALKEQTLGITYVITPSL